MVLIKQDILITVVFASCTPCALYAVAVTLDVNNRAMMQHPGGDGASSRNFRADFLPRGIGLLELKMLEPFHSALR